MKKKQTTAKREVIDERELKKEFGKILSIKYQGNTGKRLNTIKQQP